MQRALTCFWVVLNSSPPQHFIRHRLAIRNVATAVLAKLGLIKVTEADAVGIIFIHFILLLMVLHKLFILVLDLKVK